MEVKVKVISSPKNESIEVTKTGRLVVSIKEKREGGRANRRLVELLSEYYGVEEKNVIIVKGHKDTSKTLLIHGIQGVL